MRVLVIGSGGREHALCWALASSPLLTKLWCAPGNSGIASVAECVAIGAMDIPALVAFARTNRIDLVVPGPEGPLVAGITEAMDMIGVACCGPTQRAAQLESSKFFTKDICQAAGIPTAACQRFTDAAAARDYIVGRPVPIVVKADGLAAGKGVVVAETEAEALSAIETMMEQRAFGEAGASVLIEEFLQGDEVSFFALCDGESAIPLGAARDHKRLGTGDTGPNTGGMGAYSPVRVFSTESQDWVMHHIIRPTLAEMTKRDMPYRGILFAGLMLTDAGIKLIEFNVRFGDPECQALVLRMDGDLLEAFRATCFGKLNGYRMAWKDRTSIAVVLTAPGYPDAPEYGSVIYGLHTISSRNVQIFHAGTSVAGNVLRAAGGRVLTICAIADDLLAAHSLVYSAVDQIDWPEGYCRRDIGWRGLI